MKVLITGIQGFIGSHLADRLIDEGHEVYGIDDLSGGARYNVKFNTYFVDCRDASRIDRVFKRVRPEIVFMLAANAAEHKSLFSPIDITSRNYDAFIKVLTPFIKYGGKRFVFTSSVAVYGSSQTPFGEKTVPKPEDLYGVSKLACEQSLKILSEVHGFEYVICRPFNVYGKRQNMRDPYRNVITIWMNKLLNNEQYVIYGDGTMIRPFSYIDDVARSLSQAGFKENISGRIFNVGSNRVYSLNDLSARILKIAGSDSLPLYLPRREREVQNVIVDTTHARRHLGYKDTVTLEEGLRETWSWAKAQGYQEPKVTKMELPSDKIPENWI